MGGQHERSHLPRGNALGQRGGEQQRRKQWQQRNPHFESRVTCWRCAKDSTAWLASLWRFFSTSLRKLMKNTHAALLRFINKVRKCSSCLQRLR